MTLITDLPASWQVVLAPDGQRLATVGRDGVVQIWQVPTRSIERVIDVRERPVRSLAFSPDGKLLAGGTLYGSVLLWDVETGQERSELKAEQRGVRLLAFAPDGRTLATGTLDEPILLWDVPVPPVPEIERTSEPRPSIRGESQNEDPDVWACRGRVAHPHGSNRASRGAKVRCGCRRRDARRDHGGHRVGPRRGERWYCSSGASTSVGCPRTVWERPTLAPAGRRAVCFSSSSGVVRQHYTDAYGPDSGAAARLFRRLSLRAARGGTGLRGDARRSKGAAPRPAPPPVRRGAGERHRRRGFSHCGSCVRDLAAGTTERYEARVFIDATYEGDVAAAAGCEYRLGREGRDELGEEMAGRLYKVWGGPVGPGSTGQADNAIQAFNFRLCLTPKPRRPGGDPAGRPRTTAMSSWHWPRTSGPAARRVSRGRGPWWRRSSGTGSGGCSIRSCCPMERLTPTISI